MILYRARWFSKTRELEWWNYFYLEGKVNSLVYIARNPHGEFCCCDNVGHFTRL
jgi:hypothetical protein